jgi:hypothetical protein
MTARKAIPGESNRTGTRRKSGTQAGPLVPWMGRIDRLRPNRWLCLVVGGYVLVAALCGLAVYLWRAPLPPLAIPQLAEEGSTSPLIAGRAGSKVSLEACLRQVKMRDLFKPSIPVPTEGGIGKSTAQELADRLQFVGIMEDTDGLAALVFIPNRGPETFHVGERVAEFVLKDVQPGRLTLGLGEEQAVLKR